MNFFVHEYFISFPENFHSSIVQSLTDCYVFIDSLQSREKTIQDQSVIHNDNNQIKLIK